jgi:hypothetical protein
MYSSTRFLTSVLEGGGWSKPGPDCCTPGKSTDRLGKVWRRENRLLPPGFERLTVQLVGSRYTDYATPALIMRVWTYVIIQKYVGVHI